MNASPVRFDLPQWVVGLHFTLCAAIVLSVSSLVWAHGEHSSIWEFVLGPQSKVKQVVELCYLFTNSFIALIALYAFYVARRQYKESERTRLASVYSDIAKELSSEEVFRSRLELATLEKEFYNEGGIAADFPRELHIALQALRAEARLDRYHEFIRVLYFLEHVGLLVRRQYVEALDVKLLMGDVFSGTARAFSYHISARQAEPGGSRIFEHLVSCAKY